MSEDLEKLIRYAAEKGHALRLTPEETRKLAEELGFTKAGAQPAAGSKA